MRLHDRYLFRELITPLVVCLGAFLIFFIFIFFTQRLEEIRDAKLHFVDTVEYALAMMPDIFVLLFPFILLFGMLWALSQHARHNEITALRAAGISLWRICVPYFFVGLIAAGVYFAVNEMVAPACGKWADDILTRYVKKTNDPNAKTTFYNVGFRSNHGNRLWKMGAYDSASRTMINPLVQWTAADDTQHQLRADRAVYTNDTWVFFHVEQFAEPSPHAGMVQLPAADELPMPEFTETPKFILLDLKFSDAQGTLSSRSADVPIAELWPYLQANPDLSDQEAAKLNTKLQARLAAPWTCLIVVLMAIPFGAQSGRRNLFYGVAGSIFICFTFFVLQQVSLAFGMGGHLPALVAAWLPNLFFAVVGFFLTLRVR